MHEICNDFFGFDHRFMPEGMGTWGHRGQNRGFFQTQNLILGHSWWNVLPSFNLAFGVKRGDLPWRAINLALVIAHIFCSVYSSLTPLE